MKNILPIEIIESSSYSERRLIVYLLAKKGKPGMLHRNTCLKSKRLQDLINLVNKDLIKIVFFDKKRIYFRFTDSFDNKKISVSDGCYINIK